MSFYLKSFLVMLLLASTSLQASSTFAWLEADKEVPSKSDPPISILVPTLLEEATSIFRTVNDIAFLESMKYTVSLPNHPLIDTLLMESRNGTFDNDDFPRIVTILEDGAFSMDDYKEAQKKGEAQFALLTDMLLYLEAISTTWFWDFKHYETYTIRFTRYGSGGSYDTQTGTITLMTTPTGTFKNYRNPINTIIHEIVHLGIEESLVQKHQLPHPLKERLVDTIIKILFGDRLPNYKIQNMGYESLNNHIRETIDLVDLEIALAKLNR
ncbi:MAG: hypothetical protein HRU40_03495 [Saprospiraceae bacterium]|nr:hypothetical protein [Saprospiraceae bacterium]